MKILVTGASGQLGLALRETLETQHEVVWTDLDELDVRDLAAVRAATSSEKPKTILHLAATTDVDACERDPHTAFDVNALGTRYAALAAREAECELVFISTDYVFDGASQLPYQEYDSPHALNVYGRSKLHGERAVLSLVPRHYIVRTSGLFAPGGVNFVRSMLKMYSQEKRVQVVIDQVCRPTYAGDLAAALTRMIGSDNFGTYHVASAGETSWFEFAKAILGELGGDPASVAPLTSEELGRPAPRPAYSVLDTGAYEHTFGHVLPHWREGLAGFAALPGKRR